MPPTLGRPRQQQQQQQYLITTTITVPAPRHRKHQQQQTQQQPLDKPESGESSTLSNHQHQHHHLRCLEQSPGANSRRQTTAAAAADPKHHYNQHRHYRRFTHADKLDFSNSYHHDTGPTKGAAVQWVCFPSLLSPVVDRGIRGMPTKFSRTPDVVMIDDGRDEIKMDTTPGVAAYGGHHHGVDLFRVDVLPVLQQLRMPSPQQQQHQPQPQPRQQPVKCPLKDGCPDRWSWNRHDKSHEVRLHGSRGHSAHFHPNWSNGTAGVRGSKGLNSGRNYWEVKISQRVFGTSMMFGVSTKRARLHVDAFVNLLGEDDQSWGLSHKGLLWHDGKWRQYTKPFRENEATVIGLLFDGTQGTLTCYKDGLCLGVAFSGLNKVTEELYPTVCSTAAKTEMSLGLMMRGFSDLQDRCRAAILARMKGDANNVDELPLPGKIKEFVKEGLH